MCAGDITVRLSTSYRWHCFRNLTAPSLGMSTHPYPSNLMHPAILASSSGPMGAVAMLLFSASSRAFVNCCSASIGWYVGRQSSLQRSGNSGSTAEVLSYSCIREMVRLPEAGQQQVILSCQLGLLEALLSHFWLVQALLIVICQDALQLFPGPLCLASPASCLTLTTCAHTALAICRKLTVLHIMKACQPWCCTHRTW